jgi:hypothetical protein
MRRVTVLVTALALALAASVGTSYATAPTFTITPLLEPNGGSETAISYSATGFGAMTALSWLSPFGTHMWTGQFGEAPVDQGVFDLNLAPGISGGEDADIDLGSTGTLHATSLIFIDNGSRLGVSALACPKANTSNDFASCKVQVIDTTNSDRQWITSDGKHVWISYHDPFQAALVHVQRSDDDGFTFHRVSDPVVGQGSTTGNSTFNNTNGPIVADPSTHTLYDIFTAGEAGLQKATNTLFNNVYVSRSFDGGVTWTAQLVYHTPLGTAQDNIFPSLAVDPRDGTVYATWSDQAHVFISKSTDQGASWSKAIVVNSAAVATAVEPWVTALNGTVDAVFYGTNVAGNSNTETTATWNVYLAQSTNAGADFLQTTVTTSPNHVGPICTGGVSCASGTRNLLDLFEIAIDPANGKAGIIYTDDTLTKDSSGKPLPQAVLAQQS